MLHNSIQGVLTNGILNLKVSSIQLGSIETFSPRDTFRLEGIETFCVQKIKQEKIVLFIKILKYNKFSCINFCITIITGLHVKFFVSQCRNIPNIIFTK